jgi:hypothetical protein
MGTVWFFANSVQTPEDLALRAIVGGSICIVAILFIYTLTRNRLKSAYIFYICIIACATIISLILLAEAIQSITTAGVIL